MILVDTNIWIDFFHGKKQASTLSQYLIENKICLHPWILTELSLGHLGPQRKKILSDLMSLPQMEVFEHDAIHDFIESEKLYGKGLSFVDVQLLYAALADDCLLWTGDKTLNSMAHRYNRDLTHN